MPMWAYPVAAALEPHVASCVGYEYVLDPDAVHYGLPSTTITVIIAFDEPLDCGWLGELDRSRHAALASGFHLRPALIRTHGHQCGIQLSLTPLGCRTLLGRPASELAHQSVDATELGLSASLVDRLQGESWPRRFLFLEDALLRRVARAEPRISPEVTEAWRLLRLSHGSHSVSDLADTVGYSRRHLQTRFSAEFGLTPKLVGRLMRFERARTLLARGVGLADVARASGFADQSHLNRDWKALAGRPPGDREEFPNIQDGTP